jgi:cytidylate kinase
MYRIITVEREYGCGGGEIACELAKRLGWKLWDQALTQEIAGMAKVDCAEVERCSERVDSAFQRLVGVFLRGSYERNMPVSGHEPFNTDRFVALGEQVMGSAAKAGNCIIVGRGAPYFLRERGDAFHVFLYAPFAEKMRRLKALGKSEKEAEELLNTIDRDRITFVKRYFNADWPTRSLYHVMINTAIGNANAIATIFDTMNILERGPIRVQPPSHSSEQDATR